MKKIIFQIVNTFCLFFIITEIEAQVKTKVFFNEIPKLKFGKDLENVVERNIQAPVIFSKLLASGISDLKNTKEYKNKFALPVL